MSDITQLCERKLIVSLLLGGDGGDASDTRGNTSSLQDQADVESKLGVVWFQGSFLSLWNFLVFRSIK